MPYTADEARIIEENEQNLANNESFYLNPRGRQALGRMTVICLILNRTIGSGIFVTPTKVLNGTGSVGAALLFWATGAIIATCGLLVWLECGLSIPQRFVGESLHRQGVPRSGGEKNYLEFMFASPRYRTTCIYGIMFVVLGNLSGNAIAFGIYVLQAANPTISEPNRASVIGLAMAVMSAAVLIHVFSRRGGILLNNIFAVIKVGLLLLMIILGILRACGVRIGQTTPRPNNFNTQTSFKTQRHDVASYADSLFYILYAFSGVQQPFYVLGEFKSPRRIFPKYTLSALGITILLFMLVNISYLLVVSKDQIIGHSNIDMATIFFEDVFGTKYGAERAMAAVIAFCIFGNILVMTFTAARVKQEIAKEGIFYEKLSLILGRSYNTPWEWVRRKWGRHSNVDPVGERDQSPMAALALHWLTSVILIVVTFPLKSATAYSVLVYLFCYTLVVLVGFWVSIGLLWTKWRKSRFGEEFNWQISRQYAPFISPLHVIIYLMACGFLLVASWIPPNPNSPFAQAHQGYPWYIVPAIGVSAPLWGYLWYLGLLLYQRIKHRDLCSEREAYWKEDEDNPNEFVQIAEKITFTWEPWSPDRNGHEVRHRKNFDEDDGRPVDMVARRAPTNDSLGEYLRV